MSFYMYVKFKLSGRHHSTKRSEWTKFATQAETVGAARAAAGAFTAVATVDGWFMTIFFFYLVTLVKNRITTIRWRIEQEQYIGSIAMQMQIVFYGRMDMDGFSTLFLKPKKCHYHARRGFVDRFLVVYSWDKQGVSWVCLHLVG